jgi:hypothetical protein
MQIPQCYETYILGLAAGNYEPQKEREKFPFEKKHHRQSLSHVIIASLKFQSYNILSSNGQFYGTHTCPWIMIPVGA